MRNVYNKISNKKKWFYTLMFIGILTGIVYSLISKEHPLIMVLFYNPTDTYMDFFYSLYDTFSFQPYEMHGIYPPLTYLIFFGLQQLIPYNTVELGAAAIRSSQMGQMVFFYFMMVSIGIVCYIIMKNKKGIEGEKLLFLILMLTSTPFFYAFERGNIIILALAFLAIFVFGKDSNNKYVREISFVCLAISAAIKIYPAIFGLLLLIERRWKEAGRCVLYGIVVFFIPFCFTGGFQKIPLFINNIIGASDLFLDTGSGYKVNFLVTVDELINFLRIGNFKVVEILSRLGVFAIVLMSIVVIWFYAEKWKKIAILSALLIGIPSFSYVYTMVFMMIPLIVFLDDEKHSKGWDEIYSLFFAGMFVLCIFKVPKVFEGNGGVWGYTFSTFLEGTMLLGFFTFLVVDGAIQMYKTLKIRKEIEG